LKILAGNVAYIVVITECFLIFGGRREQVTHKLMITESMEEALEKCINVVSFVIYHLIGFNSYF
jgi:hypothetical protein